METGGGDIHDPDVDFSAIDWIDRTLHSDGYDVPSLGNRQPRAVGKAEATRNVAGRASLAVGVDEPCCGRPGPFDPMAEFCFPTLDRRLGEPPVTTL